MATIKDVAEEAGVSVATVSAVVNSDSGVNVSDELTKKVKKAIKEMNYRPNRIARALSKRETHALAYIVPTIKNNFFSQMAHLIEDKAFDKGYGVYLCNTHSKSDRVKLYIDNLIENRVAGVVTTLTWEILENNLIESIKKEDIPVIGLAGARVINDIDTITIDDVEGTKLAVKHLIKKGNNIISFIGIKNSKTTEKRLKGYKQALEEASITFEQSYIKLGSCFKREGGYILAGELIEEKPEVDAVFVYNDVMATGVVDKFNELGIKVPEEIAVIGYDDSVAKFTKPKLTTIAVHKRKMVELGMKLLFKRINGEQFDYRHEKILPKLIKRESV